MKNPTVRSVLASIALLSTLGLSRSAEAAYSLVWSDEFNGSSLNTSDWNIDTGNGCPSLCGWGNAELQYYRPQNVTVTGGHLVLTARAESYAGYSFTSGKITTKNKQSFLYGRFEMRAKLPTGNGMWPAFWMLSQDDAYGGWASSGEIDIMESANGTTYINGTIHYGGSYPNNTYSGGTYAPPGTNFANDFHVYAIEWEPDVIRWYVDGNLYATRTSSQWYSSAAPGNPRAPFDQDFYLLLNAAVGGNYTGCTSPGCVTANLPQEFIVDYVRVYADIDNQLPSVTINAPSSGSILPVGDISIEVEASDPDGSIAVVEFYEGSTLLGSDTEAPYSFVWASVSDGCYEIVVRAIDDLGGAQEDRVDVTVGLGCGQLPYLGDTFVFPTRIQAEDFDEGGSGVAYQDADASNNGGQYRTDEQVDIELCTDSGGGYNVGWVNPSEWIEYTVTAPHGGEYLLRARVAATAGGGAFRLEFAGSDRSGAIAVPATGGWQAWTDVDFPVILDGGTQVMRFVPMAGEFNLNYFDVLSTPTAAPASLGRTLIERLDSYPNPFNPRTTIRFALQNASTIDLVIYDAAGRRVKTLAASEPVVPGSQERTWDGRDDSGRIVAGGVYFARLDAQAESQTIRLVLLK